MPEVWMEMKTYEVRLLCEEGGCDGEMKWTEVALMSNPPQYPHVCSKCRAKQTLVNRRYPFTAYRQIESHYATPQQHQTATSAEKPNETD